MQKLISFCFRPLPKGVTRAPGRPIPSGVFMVVFCYKENIEDLIFDPADFMKEIKDTRATYYAQDITVPYVQKKDLSAFSLDLQNSCGFMLPVVFYSFIFRSFQLAQPASGTSSLPLFVYDAQPTFCMGMVAALNFNYLYAVNDQANLKASFVNSLKKLLLGRFDDGFLTELMSYFNRVLPTIQIRPRGRPSTSTPHRTSLV